MGERTLGDFYKQLDRCTSKEVTHYQWMSERSRPMTCITYIEIPAAVDMQETEGLSDEQMKSLIRERFVCVLAQALASLEEQPCQLNSEQKK